MDEFFNEEQSERVKKELKLLDETINSLKNTIKTKQRIFEKDAFVSATVVFHVQYLSLQRRLSLPDIRLN